MTQIHTALEDRSNQELLAELRGVYAERAVGFADRQPLTEGAQAAHTGAVHAKGAQAEAAEVEGQDLGAERARRVEAERAAAAGGRRNRGTS